MGITNNITNVDVTNVKIIFKELYKKRHCFHTNDALIAKCWRFDSELRVPEAHLSAYFRFKLRLSAIIAMNSEFVGLPLMLETV